MDFKFLLGNVTKMRYIGVASPISMTCYMMFEAQTPDGLSSNPDSAIC